MIQLYGHFSNFLSFAQVSRAYATALEAARLPFQVWNIDDMLGLNKMSQWPMGLDSDAEIGIAIDYPPVAKNWLTDHKVRILATVCESNRIPNEWVEVCNHYTDYVFVPSRFCREAFLASGVTVPVLIVPHGIWPSMLQAEKLPLPGGITNFLHVTGAVSFPQRKGTSKLLRAFADIHKIYHCTLTIVTPIDMTPVIQAAGIDPYKVHYVRPKDGLTPFEMGNLIRKHHAVVQPSRGEGFGLCPLEARCLGVPAILTNDTGHVDHIASCDTLIPTGDYVRMDTQGNAVGHAPLVSEHDVFVALDSFIRNQKKRTQETQNWARSNAHKHFWTTVLSDGMKFVSKFVSKKRKKLGGSVG